MSLCAFSSVFLQQNRTSTVEEVLPLVRSRYQYPLMQPSQTEPVHPYDYMALQRDVIRAFLVGKSYFHPPGDHLRQPFKFYKPKTDSLVLGVSLADVEILGQFLKDDSGLKVGLICLRTSLFTTEMSLCTLFNSVNWTHQLSRSLSASFMQPITMLCWQWQRA